MLRLENVSMYYHNGDSVSVGIREINLELKRGEFVLITGESGSGKSSLLNVMSFMLPYHDGELYLYDVPTSAFDESEREVFRREHMGFVFQNYRLIDSYTALQNVVSAMLMQGVEQQEATARAKVYLEKVGLKGYENRRATKLSSGQKQRLAIARALAKETDIIVADEPTGNLDSENGKQIVELLASLSREKLVIMVSHNIEEAEPYATRRIRMHDGNVMADEILKPEAVVLEDGERPQPIEIERGKLAGRLAGFNLKAQPKKTALILAFLFFAAVASFVFMGSFLSSMDDTPAKIYNDEAFKNGNLSRIIIRRDDGAVMSQADYDFFRSVEYVQEVDLYDYINDCNYYRDLGSDYSRRYQTQELRIGAEVIGYINYTSVEFHNNTRYLRSSTCLDESKLAYGRLPEKVNEIVLYGTDESLVGSVQRVFFRDMRTWMMSQHAFLDMTVVGLVKTPTSQVYFSPLLAKAFMFNASPTGYAYMTFQNPDSGSDNWAFPLKPVVFPDPSIPMGTVKVNDYIISNFDPIAEKIENHGSFSIQLSYRTGTADDVQWMQQYFDVDRVDEKDLWESIGFSLKTVSAVDNDLPRESVSVNDEEFYATIGDYESSQASLYIKDYAYTDGVLKELQADGTYIAMSVYRAGSLSYDPAKVKARLVTLAISAGAFVVLFVLEIIVLCAFLRFKRNDFATLRSLGMDSTVMHKLNRKELMRCELYALIIAAALIVTASFLNISYLDNILKYCRWYHVLFVLVCNLGVSWLLCAMVNHDLDKTFSGAKKRSRKAR